MSSNDLTGYPSVYEYHRRQIADLTADRNALLSALDDIVTAWELPGDHCELGDAIWSARNLLRRPRVEIGNAATCRTGVTDSAFTQNMEEQR